MEGVRAVEVGGAINVVRADMGGCAHGYPVDTAMDTLRTTPSLGP